MVVRGAEIQCDTTLLALSFEPLTHILGSKVRYDSGW